MNVLMLSYLSKLCKHACTLIAATWLSACGVAYISPAVDQDDSNVRIVPLNAASVVAANASPYQPKQLPNVFFQATGTGSGLRGAVVSPEPSLPPQQRPATLATRIPPDVASTPYRIGVGDIVLIATKLEGDTVAELSELLAAQNSRQGYTIQDDGAITIPEVGRVQLAGMTLEEAEDQLFQSLIANQIDPTFSLEIAEFNAQRVTIGGGVVNAAVVPITLSPLRLSEALARAGGINLADAEFASIRIYRGDTLYQVPLTAYLAQADLQQLRLIDGDNVFVDAAFELDKAQAYFEEQITLVQLRQASRIQALAELETEITLRAAGLAEQCTNFESQIALDAVDRDYVYLTGEVTQPGRFAMPFGRSASLADALFSEGGFTSQTANPAQIYVLRGAQDDQAVITAWHLDARNVANMVVATQMQLRPNDIIFIAEQPITRWNRFVQQLVPSLLTTGAGLAAN